MSTPVALLKIPNDRDLIDLDTFSFSYVMSPENGKRKNQPNIVCDVTSDKIVLKNRVNGRPVSSIDASGNTKCEKRKCSESDKLVFNQTVVDNCILSKSFDYIRKREDRKKTNDQNESVKAIEEEQYYIYNAEIFRAIFLTIGIGGMVYHMAQ